MRDFWCSAMHQSVGTMAPGLGNIRDFVFSSAVTCYKKESEYDLEIPQSHTADQPTAP